MRNEYDEFVNKSKCMGECGKLHDYNEMVWIKDNYGINFKLTCWDCHDEVEKEVRKNNYGDYLTDEELYGEDY